MVQPGKRVSPTKTPRQDSQWPQAAARKHKHRQNEGESKIMRYLGTVGRHLAAAATTALLLAISANASSAFADDAGTIHWLTARDETNATVKAIVAIAADYKKDHPDFDLKLESIPDRPSYLQKVRILAASNELPELFDADPEPYFEDVAKAGLVVDIGKLYSDLGLTDSLYPVSIAYPKFDDGSLYLITWQANAEYFFYNKDLFKQAGVEPPTTFDEFLAVCAKLKAAGITPISMDGKDQWPILRYLAFLPFRATGNEFLDDLKNGKAKMTDPVGIAASKFVQNLGENYFQEGFADADYTTSLNLFLSGKAAIYYQGTWELPSFLDANSNLKPNIGYFKMPTNGANDKSPATDFFANSGIGTAVSVKGDTPQVRDFLKYLLSHYADTVLYQYQLIPSLKPTIRPDLAPIYKDISADIAGVKDFSKVWDVRLDPGTVDVIGRESTVLALGRITPEQFGQEVDDSIQQYLQSK
jgi:raffinose/stachyose/melibiose transport system substrate-binding protein